MTDKGIRIRRKEVHNYITFDYELFVQFCILYWFSPGFLL